MHTHISSIYQLYPPNFKLKIGGFTQNERRGEGEGEERQKARAKEISQYRKFCKKVEEKSQGSSVC